METNVIGDKSSFAVEFGEIFLQGGATFGQGGLWISGHQLHEAGTSVCLDTVLAGLQGIANATPIKDRQPFSPSSAEELLLMMRGQGLADVHQHYFLPIEAFDDFLKLFFKGPEYITFVWAVHPEVIDLAVYQGYPKGVQTSLVEGSEFRHVVDQFARLVKMTKG